MALWQKLRVVAMCWLRVQIDQQLQGRTRLASLLAENQVAWRKLNYREERQLEMGQLQERERG